MKRSLWTFGVLQALSTLMFSGLTVVPSSIWFLALVVFFETLTGGMGSAAFGAFMLLLTNKKFTATQYALLSSLMGVPRIFMGSTTGYLAKHLGWSNFFIICTLIAIPGLLLLSRFKRWMPDKN